MANQNKLTSDGLTVGSGTITNFIPAFGSNVVGTGVATVTVPSSDKSITKSPTLGTVYAFNIGIGRENSIRLPSGGMYFYVVNSSTASSMTPEASEVAGTLRIIPENVTSGGATIYTSPDRFNSRVGGGFVRVE